MSILDQLLGGGDNASVSNNSDTSNNEVGANPVFGLSLDDVLHSSSTDDDGDSSSFTGIGGLSIGFGSPIYLGSSSSSDSSDQQVSDSDSGGLLGGLL
ncbi:MAG: hypothetical protein ABW043_02790 [Devosia sp.]|uniref:hypothetical protein n=1 Tax=Devosia sp. TaxID=1871048 RepID=UPI0033916354